MLSTPHTPPPRPATLDATVPSVTKLKWTSPIRKPHPSQTSSNSLHSSMKSTQTQLNAKPTSILHASPLKKRVELRGPAGEGIHKSVKELKDWWESVAREKPSGEEVVKKSLIGHTHRMGKLISGIFEHCNDLGWEVNWTWTVYIRCLSRYEWSPSCIPKSKNHSSSKSHFILPICILNLNW